MEALIKKITHKLNSIRIDYSIQTLVYSENNTSYCKNFFHNYAIELDLLSHHFQKVFYTQSNLSYYLKNLSFYKVFKSLKAFADFDASLFFIIFFHFVRQVFFTNSLNKLGSFSAFVRTLNYHHTDA